MKNYVVREPLPQEAQENLKLYPEFLRKLLFYRGISSSDEAQAFLNPNYETHLHDPYLMKDMDKAVERILRAIKSSEKILIYSDYDADGIPAAVVMHDFLKLIKYENFEIYIPHRHAEGYGLHLEAVHTFIGKGIKLIITLDCGIVDNDEVRHAQDAGIDVIITDHHLPGEQLPPAYAVVNAKRNDCEYPYDMLCGSGVAFKLVQALIKKGNFGLTAGSEKWLLDMVGLATLSDMVPLKGENRALAHYGLRVLRKSRRPGLLKLLSEVRVQQQHITEDDVGFMITPRINAASRMGIPLDAFNLLSTQDEVQAGALAKHLHEINHERKGLVAALVKEIKKILNDRTDHYESRTVIVIGNPSWRPAILGLAANTIAEQVNKPVFLWGREDGKEIKGSCRSNGITNLKELMEVAKNSFSQYGGHSFSGGFAIDPDKIHTFEDAIEKAHVVLLKNQKAIDESDVKDFVDARLSLDDITWQTYSQIEKLAPFGMDNPKPLFLLDHIVVEDFKQFGKGSEHLELSFKDSRNKVIKAIGFFTTPDDFDIRLTKNTPINLVAHLEKSVFRYTPELRLRIVDII